MRYNSKIFAQLAGLAVVASAWAADRVTVEDWRSYLVGARGIPAEWKEQTWGIRFRDRLGKWSAGPASSEREG